MARDVFLYLEKKLETVFEKSQWKDDGSKKFSSGLSEMRQSMYNMNSIEQDVREDVKRAENLLSKYGL